MSKCRVYVMGVLGSSIVLAAGGVSAWDDDDCIQECKQVYAKDVSSGPDDCTAFRDPICIDNLWVTPPSDGEHAICLPPTEPENTPIYQCKGNCTDLCPEAFSEYEPPEDYDDGTTCGSSTDNASVQECFGGGGGT